MTLVFVARNNGPSAAPRSIFTDLLSSSLVNCRVSCSGATGGASCVVAATPFSGGNVTQVVNLPAQSSTTITVHCKATCAAVGHLSSVASIAAVAGVYDINLSNNFAAPTTTSVSAALLSVAATTVNDRLACRGDHAVLTALATGGKAPYSFALDGSSAFQSSAAIDVAVGRHTITVKDGNGCMAVSNGVLFVEPATSVRCGVMRHF